ncbi:MAG TPA: S8 family serine peptidase [Candidatus Binatia bacterium]|nr:S8 family serine peptidase [Candidatus Binatia bacterium]
MRRAPRPFASAALFLTLALFASSATAAPRSVSPALAHIEPGTDLSDRFLTKGRNGETMIELIVEGDVPPGLLRARGIEVNTVAGRMMTARCPIGLLQALLAMPDVDRVSVAERCKPNLDRSAPDTHVNALRTITPPVITGQTGAGILVGDVDTGVDLGHPDFKHQDGTTRLLSVWDQTASTGTPPAGFTYGAEFTAAQINAGTATETDTDGHGTHVLGIAGGNGSGTGNGQPAFTYVGMAPEADLVMVKTTFATSSIIDGVNYVFQRAAALGKQAVVNLSLGTEDGPHDGTYGFDTMVNALTGPGRIVVASAGNTGEDDMHGRLDLNGTTPQSMTVTVPTYTKNAGTQNDYLLFSGWYAGADQVSLTIITPSGTTIGPIATGLSSTSNNTGDGYINAYNGTTAPANGDHEIYVEIFDAFANKAPKSGTWEFRLTPVALMTTGIADMYLYGDHLGNGASLARFVQGNTFGGVVGSPGSADSVITVAAHVTKECWTAVDGSRYCWNPTPTVNSIASFSSQGPRRDGALKPDLSAPGFGVVSTKSSLYNPATALIAQDGVHHIEAGTSMSSPHVTGSVAILLAQAAWAGQSPSAIKARLRSTAHADAFTGSVPNSVWGYGKLDIQAAAAPLFLATVTHPSKGAQIPPGKPDSITVVVGGASADSVEFDLSTDGGATYPVRLGTLYGVSPGPPRSLAYFVDGAYSTLQAKVRATAHAGATTYVASSDSLFLISAPAAVEVDASSPRPRFALAANTPNPFNPVTTIRFELAQGGRASLRVYSAQGRLVRTLVNERLDAGGYRIRWDGRDEAGRGVASGIYFYELNEGSRSLTRRMSLLK